MIFNANCFLKGDNFHELSKLFSRKHKKNIIVSHRVVRLTSYYF